MAAQPDRLLALLQRADRERMAQLTAQGQTPSVLENGNPNVRLGKALVTPEPTELNHTPPDVPKEGPTVVRRTEPIPVPGELRENWETQQGNLAIEKLQSRSATEKGPDGDRLKALLEKDLQDRNITPPTPDNTPRPSPQPTPGPRV